MGATDLCDHAMQQRMRPRTLDEVLRAASPARSTSRDRA